MLFSSISFIYYFLPVLLLGYFLTPKKLKNFVLLIFSLIFYFLGEPKYIWVLIISCTINYFLAKLINKSTSKKTRKVFLILSVVYNIVQLLIFKYTDFFISNINQIFNSHINYLYIVMPIGISFFTFQAMSYVIDVYRQKHDCARNLLDFMTYVALFPQLIAGPIVRYIDVEKEMKDRTVNAQMFTNGVKRFTIGLGKKVLLANVLGEMVAALTEIDLLASWLRPVGYTLQIYFDFSGYSDMAIGLGLMFGFKFLENFNYPLISGSITEFWRRWHISLSSWFKDYVYIPLGGNRVGKIKWLRNIMIVWFLTGFWHGASWNFILWGIYFGIILIIEKLWLKKYLDKTKVIKYLYTSIIVIISFLIFSTESISAILKNLKGMFMIGNIQLISHQTLYHFKNNIILLVVSIIGATPLMRNIARKLEGKRIMIFLEPLFYVGLLILTTAFLIDESFNPFLYFRF